MVGWLVGFYAVSTIVSYLMPSPLYAYISNVYGCGPLANE